MVLSCFLLSQLLNFLFLVIGEKNPSTPGGLTLRPVPLHGYASSSFTLESVHDSLCRHLPIISDLLFNSTQSGGSLLYPFLPNAMCILSVLQRSHILAPGLYPNARSTMLHFMVKSFLAFFFVILPHLAYLITDQPLLPVSHKPSQN